MEHNELQAYYLRRIARENEELAGRLLVTFTHHPANIDMRQTVLANLHNTGSRIYVGSTAKVGGEFLAYIGGGGSCGAKPHPYPDEVHYQLGDQAQTEQQLCMRIAQKDPTDGKKVVAKQGFRVLNTSFSKLETKVTPIYIAIWH